MRHDNRGIQQTILALLILTWTVCPVSATETTAIFQSEKPKVEVVFALDTTGSMGGLIAAAKEKIWSIASTLASADPAPSIKMGLVGYRDRGDAYVTTLTPLSDDLDGVYTQLMRFQANGGGDSPESVNQALNEAVNRTQWSKDPLTYRVIFLVGDAPPHMDYQNDIPYSRTCRMALNRDIIINTIQCGTMAQTRGIWKKIAHSANGNYFRVAQAGNAVLYDTPYDTKISELSRKMDDTRLYYGRADHIEKMEKRKEDAEKLYETAAPSAMARRSVFNTKKSGAKNFLGAQELVDAVSTGKVKLEELNKELLPAKLRNMSPDRLRQHINAQIKKRETIKAKIDDLAQKRKTFIVEKVKKEKDGGVGSLDAQIYKCIRKQAAEKKIVYKEGPAY